jgi:hypothetical protein
MSCLNSEVIAPAFASTAAELCLWGRATAVMAREVHSEGALLIPRLIPLPGRALHVAASQFIRRTAEPLHLGGRTKPTQDRVSQSGVNQQAEPVALLGSFLEAVTIRA